MQTRVDVRRAAPRGERSLNRFVQCLGKKWEFCARRSKEPRAKGSMRLKKFDRVHREWCMCFEWKHLLKRGGRVKRTHEVGIGRG